MAASKLKHQSPRNGKLSVVIPAYNAAKLIHVPITALQAQTFTDWQCFIVNDGSIDNTAEVVEQLTEGDPRFNLINKENGGSASARNRGFEASDSEFVFFIDSDDRISEGLLEKAHKAMMQDTELELVFAQGIIVDPNDGTETPAESREVSKKDLVMCTGMFAGSGNMIRRHVWQRVGGFPEDELYKKGAQDEAFWISNAAFGVKSVVVKDEFFYYIRHAQGITKSHVATLRIRFIKTHVKKYGSIMREVGIRPRKYMALKAASIIRKVMYAKDYSTTLKLSLNMLCFTPFDKKLWYYTKVAAVSSLRNVIKR